MKQLPDVNAEAGLPTALAIQQAKTQFDGEPSTSAVFNHLRNATIHGPPEILRDGATVQAGAQTAQAIVFDMGLELCSDVELANLRELQAWFNASYKASEPYALSNVSKETIRQRDAIEAKLAAGESTEGMAMQDRDTISRTFLAHLHSGDAARVRKTATAKLLCKPILTKFWTALEDYMRNIEQTDRLQCAAFGLPFKPSLLWQACYSVASTYKPESRLRGGSVLTPKTILAGLIEL